MNDKFLLLGLANGGLFLARQIRKQWPKSIIYGIGNPNTDVGRYSKAINRFFPATNADEAYDAILKIHIELGEEIKAFICSNPMLEWLVGKYPDVFDLLDFENDYSVYEVFSDKNKAKELCQKLGVNVPVGYDLSNVEDLKGILYPVVIKPSEKMTTLGVGKCICLDSVGNLIRFLEETDSLGIDRGKLICQQFVAGDNRWEYGYGGFFQNGNPTVDICFHQFRQQPQGLSCYVREMSNDNLKHRIIELVRPILDTTKINGFVEFDIKQDEKSGTLYLLDVNPRPWKSCDMLALKLGKSTVFSPKTNNRRVVWRQPYLELLSRMNVHNPSYKECKRIACGRDYSQCLALFSWHDMKPYVKRFNVVVDEIFNKIIGKLK